MNTQRKTRNGQTMSVWEILNIFKPEKDAEGKTRLLLYALSVLLTPLTLGGVLWGYVRSYNRYLRDKDYPPVLVNLPNVVRTAMIIGGVLIWAVLFICLFVLTLFFKTFFSEQFVNSPAPFMFLGFNFVFTLIVFFIFNRWRSKVMRRQIAGSRYGTARLAWEEELADLTGLRGIYIGGNHYAYNKQGHIITICKTRGGKGTDLIVPNLLGKGGYEGSWVIIDPKAENIAITERYQRSIGTVLALDPWGLHTKEGATFNPLDLLSSNPADDRIADDADSLAEMIVPADAKSKDPFFNDRARALVSGLILHIAISQQKEFRTLTTLWKWLRLNLEDWIELLGSMVMSDNPIVRAAASETENVMTSTPKTFASILSTAQQFTDFLKSAPLQRSLASSSFDVKDLSNGKTTLYVVIPADLITTKFQWLRLIITTSLRAVVRNRNKRVTFLLDEFSSLGYMREIETALNTLSGYNITLWPILTSLTALRNQYPESWENFLANASIRHFTGVGDNFTAEYVSNLLGDTTIVSTEGTKENWRHESTARKLLTPDEVRRGSAEHIFTFIEQRHPIDFARRPYFEMPDLEGRYDPNPYYKSEEIFQQTT